MFSVFGFGVIQAVCQIVTVIMVGDTDHINFANYPDGESREIPVRETIETHKKYYELWE